MVVFLLSLFLLSPSHHIALYHARAQVIEESTLAPLPSLLKKDETFKRMLKNRGKALQEHIALEKKNNASAPSSYAELEDMPLLTGAQIEKPLALAYSHAEEQGPRKTMEDAHFFIEIPQGFLTAVLDGHGGEAVAQYASHELQKRFSQTLARLKGNVHQTFETLLHEIHEEIIKNPAWDGMGSTCVLCFIDKATNLIYTATLADSEANIYRTIQGKLKSIPLSCIRDWTHKKEEARALLAIEDKDARRLFLATSHPKYRRYPMPFGLNVSRALGDKAFTGTKEKPAVIHKPKITVEKLFHGDLLILACDGLKDFCTEAEIIEQIAVSRFSNLAEQLAKFALFKKTEDNVTVVAIQVGKL